MEQINQYLPLVIAVGVIVVIALMIVIALGQRKLFKNIISNKFSMTDIEEVNIHTGKKTYAVIVSNKSMNDAGITAVGVVSGLKYFDFKDTYREMNEVSGDTLVIMPRSPIQTRFGNGRPRTADLFQPEKRKIPARKDLRYRQHGHDLFAAREEFP